MTQRIVVVGGGFAGLWSAASAARARALFSVPEVELEIVLVAPDPFHTIRVRCYEAELTNVRVPIDDVLGPIDVRRIEGVVTRIEPRSCRLAIEATAGGVSEITYDRLILAAGSRLAAPRIPIDQPVFDIDTYESAQRLAAHLAGLARQPTSDGIATAVVIGGGLVGIEIACELPSRLRAMLGDEAAARVVLVDHGAIGAGMGEGQGVVGAALHALGVETRSHTEVTAVDATGVILTGGEHIACATVIFATGMRASPLAGNLGVICDPMGRVPVDRFLQVAGVQSIYAAGDCAAALADDAGHMTVMSCQHARPMGRLAGHNAVCDIAGRADERLPFAAPDYVTVLDLGPHGALYTAGWERDTVVATGAEAKVTKRAINGTRIYPPARATRETILAAAAPVIQARPPAR